MKSFSSIEPAWINDEESKKKKKFQDIKASDYDYGVDNDYINTFLKDSESFISSSQDDYKNINYKTAESIYKAKKDKNSDLKFRANTIKAYLNANRDNIDSSYSEGLMKYLDSFNRESDNISNSYRKAFDSFNSDEAKRTYFENTLNNAKAPFENKQAIKNENDAAELAAQMLTNGSSYSDLSSSIDRLQNIRGGAKRRDNNTDVYDKAIEKLQNIKDTAYKDGLKTTDVESAEQRQLQYEDNKKRMAQLGDKSSEEYKRLSEENKIYERDQKAVDETTVTSQRKDYKEKSANRDFKNPELTDTSSVGTVFDNIISLGHLIPTEQSNDNIPDKLGAYINQVTSEQKEAYDKIPFYHAGDALSSVLYQGTSNAWDFLNDDEIDTYYYLYNSEGKDKAYEYLDGLTNTLQKRKQGKKDEEVEASEGLDLLIRNASVLPDAIVGGPLGFADNAINTMNGKSIKPYSPYQELANTSQKVVDRTATGIDTLTGNKAIPGIDFSLGDAYQAVMSLAESTIGVATNPTIYAAAMGMSAARTKAQELYESGATDEQILADSLLTGTAEMLFEELSLDKIIKFAKNDTLKDVIISGLKGAGIEGSEEVTTDIANTINDIIVLGDEAELIKAYNQRIKEGYSESESKGLAIADLGKQLGKSFLGGAIAGSGTGVAASYTKAKENVKSGIKDIAVGSQLNLNNNVNRLVDTALQMDNDVENATDLKALAQKIVDNNYKASNRQIGKLQRMVQDANLAEIQGSGATIAKQTIKAELQSQGVAENDLEKATNAIYKKEFSGEPLTYAEEKAITSEAAQAAIQNVRNQSEDIATKAQMRQERYMKNFADTQSLTQKEANPTVDIEDLDISDDGKTYIKGTNEAVDIKNIAKISKDDIVVTLSNGKTESVKNLDLGNEDTAIAYQSMLDMVKDSGVEVTPTVANTIVNLQNASGIENSAIYYKAATEVLENGWIGNNKYSLNTFAVELPENVRNEIYTLGRQLRQNYATNRKETIKNKKAPAKMGLTQLEGIPLRKLNVVQQSGVKVMQQFSKNTGLNITFFKSTKIDGKFVSRYGTDNGFFDPDTNTIYIDVNAGVKGQGFILYTAAHELTHFIREWSPEHFKTFADYLVEQYNKNGQSVDELVREKQRRLRRKLTYDQAYEEVIADSCESFLKDTDLIERSAELKNRDNTLWEKIKTYLSDLLDKVRALYSRFTPDSYEGNYVRTMRDSIQKIHEMWVNGAMSAIEIYNKAEKGENAQSGEVKYQLREYSEKQIENWSNSKRIVIYENDSQFTDFISKSKNNNTYNKKMYFGAVSADLASEIFKNTKINVESFNCSLSANEIRKIFNSHGDEAKEALRGQRAIKDKDILKIPQIIQAPDDIILSDNLYNGKPVIQFSKKEGNEKYTVNAVVSDKHLDLFVQTEYIGIKKGNLATPTGEQAPINTPEASSGTVSTNIISQTSENINPQNKKSSERIEYDYGDLFESEDAELLAGHIAEELSGNDEGVATILKRQSDVEISDAKALKLAQKIVKQFGMSSSSASEITDTLLDVLDKAKDNTLTGSQTSKLINVIADEMSKGFYVDENVKSIYKDVVNTYKGAIQLNEEQQRHIEEEGYTLSSINKELPYGMYFKKAQNGAKETVTSIFEDMSTEYPQYFSEDVYNNNSYSAATELVQALKQMKEDSTALMGDTVSKEDIHEQATLAAAEMYADVVEAKQNIKSNQAISNIKKTLRESQRRKIREAKAKAVDQKRKELLRQRERFNEKEKNIREEYKEQRKKNVEGRGKTALKNAIYKKIRTIDKMQNRSAKEKTVKQGLRNSVSELLEAAKLMFPDSISRRAMVEDGFKFETPTAEETKLLNEYKKLYEYEDKMKNQKTVSAATKEMIADKKKFFNSQLNDLFGREKKQYLETAEKENPALKSVLNELANSYRQMKNSEDGLIKEAYREEVDEALQMFIDENQNTLAINMSLKQLNDFNQIVTMILHTVRNANKTFANNLKATYSENGEQIAKEIKSIRKVKDKRSAIISKMGEMAYWNNLKPIYAFRAIGSKLLNTLYKNMQHGELVWFNDINEAKTFLEAMNKKYGVKKKLTEISDRLLKKESKQNGYTLKWDLKESYTFFDKNGKSFELNLNQIMDIYASSRRAQALQHLLAGGFVYQKDSKAKHGKVNTGATAYPLTLDIINDICSKLTQEQKSYVKEMQKFLSEVMGAKGNEVSMQLYGVKQFTEDTYWNISSSNLFTNTEEMNSKDAYVMLKSLGFTKPTQKNASNPIVLQGFLENWSNHVNKMSLYHALTLPLEDFTKSFNFKLNNPTGQFETVRSIINAAYGSAAGNYIETFLKDVNGGVQETSRLGPADKLISLDKKSKVLLNLSVVLQQPMAVIRAMAYVDPKYFGTAVFKGFALWNHNKDYEQLQKYAPIAGIKRMGSFDTGMGRGVVDYLIDGRMDNKLVKANNKIDDVLGYLPNFADELAWVQLWHAVQKETKAKYGFKIGTEENLVKSGERFNEVVQLTQVYDSTFSRSQIMRSKNTFDKMVTSFMAEPTTVMNMFVDAPLQAYRKNINAAQFTKIYATTFVSILATVAMQSLSGVGRDDDDEDKYLTFGEKYLKKLGENLLDNVWPWNYFPFLRDIWSVARGYSIDRMDMDLLTSVITGSQRLIKKIGDGTAAKEDWWKMLASIGDLSGKPITNLGREIKAAQNTYKTIHNSTFVKDKKDEWGINIAWKYQLAYDKAYEQGCSIQECKDKAESEARSYINKAVKDKYLEAYQENDHETMNSIREYMWNSQYYRSTSGSDKGRVSLSAVDKVLDDWKKKDKESQEKQKEREKVIEQRKNNKKK